MNRKTKITKLIVPLAGLGTRFAPTSIAYPKEMIHLVDRPVLDYLIKEAYLSGIKEIIFILNSNKDIVAKYYSLKYQRSYINKAFGSKKQTPPELLELLKFIKHIKFRFIKQRTTLGDGHSILLAKRFIGANESFAVTMGDLLGFGKEPFFKQLINIYRQKKRPVISVEKVSKKDTDRFGIIGVKKSRGRVHLVNDIVEKPSPSLAPSLLALTGKYILTPSIFTHLNDAAKEHRTGEVKLADSLKKLATKEELLGYECRGDIQDTGNKVDFLKATLTFSLNHPKYKEPLKKFIRSLKI